MLLTRSNKVLGIASISKGGLSGTVTDVRIILQYAINKDVEYIDFPTFNQYLKALETISEERFLRLNIWWSFNDYYRNDNEREMSV